jgi:hypothetical protein
MGVVINGRDAVLRVAKEDPQWLPAVRAALTLTERSIGEFAGAWLLDEMLRQHAPRTWYPNFRRLVTAGILEKVGESTRGGQRAYYRLVDADGVRRGLDELEREGWLSSATRLSFTGVGRSGRSDLGAAAEAILGADFPNP